MATTNASTKPAKTDAATKPAQIRLTRRSPAYWRVTIDNPPINVMGPEMVRQFQEVIELSRPTRISGSWSSTAPSTAISSITPISRPRLEDLTSHGSRVRQACRRGRTFWCV